MKIQYCSDLHLEFAANSSWIRENPIKPVGEVLIVAGDTYYLGSEFKKHEWFDYASKNWKHVFLIPGNHEFYGGYDANVCKLQDFEIQIRNNVKLVNNATVEVDNVRFIFSTMWSKIEKQIGPILGSLNDFRLIQVNNRTLNIESYNEFFQIALAFLRNEIQKETDKEKVVITHHMPSYECNLPMYKDSKLNEAFCVDLTKEIEESDIAAWIYGHSHGNIANFNIGKTKMLTNQLGYIEGGSEEFYKGNTYFDL